MKRKTIHLRFRDVPKRVEFKLLLDLCIFCDKYDCIAVLAPWISDWLSQCTIPTSPTHYADTAFVAWVVGAKGLFKFATYKLGRACSTNGARECIISSHEVLDERLPPGLSGVYAIPRLPMYTSNMVCAID